MNQPQMTGSVGTDAARQSLKSTAGEALEQAKRLNNQLEQLRNVLQSAGLLESVPETGCENAAEPSDLRWLIQELNNLNRTNANFLEDLSSTIAEELT